MLFFARPFLGLTCLRLSASASAVCPRSDRFARLSTSRNSFSTQLASRFDDTPVESARKQQDQAQRLASMLAPIQKPQAHNATWTQEDNAHIASLMMSDHDSCSLESTVSLGGSSSFDATKEITCKKTKYFALDEACQLAAQQCTLIACQVIQRSDNNAACTDFDANHQIPDSASNSSNNSTRRSVYFDDGFEEDDHRAAQQQHVFELQHAQRTEQYEREYAAHHAQLNSRDVFTDPLVEWTRHAEDDTQSNNRCEFRSLSHLQRIVVQQWLNSPALFELTFRLTRVRARVRAYNQALPAELSRFDLARDHPRLVQSVSNLAERRLLSARSFWHRVLTDTAIAYKHAVIEAQQHAQQEQPSEQDANQCDAVMQTPAREMSSEKLDHQITALRHKLDALNAELASIFDALPHELRQWRINSRLRAECKHVKTHEIANSRELQISFHNWSLLFRQLKLRYDKHNLFAQLTPLRAQQRKQLYNELSLGHTSVESFDRQNPAQAIESIQSQINKLISRSRASHQELSPGVRNWRMSPRDADLFIDQITGEEAHANKLNLSRQDYKILSQLQHFSRLYAELRIQHKAARLLDSRQRELANTRDNPHSSNSIVESRHAEDAVQTTSSCDELTQQEHVDDNQSDQELAGLIQMLTTQLIQAREDHFALASPIGELKSKIKIHLNEQTKIQKRMQREHSPNFNKHTDLVEQLSTRESRIRELVIQTRSELASLQQARINWETRIQRLKSQRRTAFRHFSRVEVFANAQAQDCDADAPQSVDCLQARTTPDQQDALFKHSWQDSSAEAALQQGDGHHAVPLVPSSVSAPASSRSLRSQVDSNSEPQHSNSSSSKAATSPLIASRLDSASKQARHVPAPTSPQRVSTELTTGSNTIANRSESMNQRRMQLNALRKERREAQEAVKSNADLIKELDRLLRSLTPPTQGAPTIQAKNSAARLDSQSPASLQQSVESIRLRLEAAIDSRRALYTRHQNAHAKFKWFKSQIAAQSQVTEDRSESDQAAVPPVESKQTLARQVASELRTGAGTEAESTSSASPSTTASIIVDEVSGATPSTATLPVIASRDDAKSNPATTVLPESNAASASDASSHLLAKQYRIAASRFLLNRHLRLQLVECQQQQVETNQAHRKVRRDIANLTRELAALAKRTEARQVAHEENSPGQITSHSPVPSPSSSDADHQQSMLQKMGLIRLRLDAAIESRRAIEIRRQTLFEQNKRLSMHAATHRQGGQTRPQDDNQQHQQQHTGEIQSNTKPRKDQRKKQAKA